MYAETNTTEAVSPTSNATTSSAFALPTYIHQPLGVIVLQITVWSTIALVGLVGNLLVCIAILFRPKMKTSMNYYLLSLAIADMGVLVFNYPIAVFKYLKPFNWLLGEGFCLFIMPTTEMFFGSSIWSITAIAVERYRNIVGKRRFLKRKSQTRSLFVIAAVWTASFAVSSVPLYPIMNYDSSNKACFPIWPNNAMMTVYFICLNVVWYVLPLGVITLTYTRIKHRVQQSTAFRRSILIESNANEKTSTHKAKQDSGRIWSQSNRTKRILTPLVTLFAVTMLPLVLFRVVFLVRPMFWMDECYNLVFGVCVFFVIINSSVNPIVYYIVSKDFKDAFKDILGSLRQRKQVFKRFSFLGSTRTFTVPEDDTGSRHVQIEGQLQFVSGI